MEEVQREEHGKLPIQPVMVLEEGEAVVEVMKGGV